MDLIKPLLSRRNAARGLLAILVAGGAALTVYFTGASGSGSGRPAPAFRTVGPENAKIQIQVFSDFACPACKNVDGQLKKLTEMYKNGVRVIYRHFPLRFLHPRSFEAAVAADCAGAQGKYPEYSETLFSGQESWNHATGEKTGEFLSYAVKMGLNSAAFEKCQADPETAKLVRLDMLEGELKKINVTPTLFVNGRRVIGSAQLIEEAKNFDNLLRAGEEKK